MTHHIRTLLIGLTALAVACGGQSPTSPSASGSGALVQGSLLSGGSPSMATQSYRPQGLPTVAGMVVSVKGTSLKATVDGGGRFTLRDVPRGNVDLQFTAPGFDSVLPVADVQSAETISLTLSLQETSVVLESSQRSLGSEVQLEARVEGLPPETLPSHFTAGGVDVTTDGTTSFLLGGSAASFGSLGVGMRVHVKGQSNATGISARTVDIQNTNGDTQIPINGIVQNFSGPQSGFQFDIDGRLIKGDGTTEFFGGSQFSGLANGVRVEVKGQQRNGFVFAARIHVEAAGSDDDDDDQDSSASIEGPLTSKAGAMPLLTLIVGGTTVRTDASTDVQRKGDTQDLSVLALGMTLHVVGDRQADGSLNARKIQIKDDVPGAAFEIEGSAGGVKGTCPALTFGVNGYAIVTDGATVFTPAVPGCSGLKSGNKVKVKGIVQTDGSIKATSVEK